MQDPILFHGSLRHNIDPVGAYEDSGMCMCDADNEQTSCNLFACVQFTDIYDALKDSALLDSIRQSGSGGGENDLLELKISDGGDNWSSGQKQLLVCRWLSIHREKTNSQAVVPFENTMTQLCCLFLRLRNSVWRGPSSVGGKSWFLTRPHLPSTPTPTG